MRRQDKEKIRLERERKEKLLEQALSSVSGIKTIAKNLANPLRYNLDYKSISRKFIKIRKLYTKIIGSTFQCIKPSKKDIGIDTIKVVHRRSWEDRNEFPTQRPLSEYDVEVTTKTGKKYYAGISYAKLRGKRFRLI